MGADRFGTCSWRDLVLFAPDSAAFAEYAALGCADDPEHLRARRERADHVQERLRAIAAAEKAAEKVAEKVVEKVMQKVVQEVTEKVGERHRGSAPGAPSWLTYERDAVTGPRIAFPVQDRVRGTVTPVAVIIDPDRGPSGPWVVEYSDGSRRPTSVAIYQGVEMFATLLLDLAREAGVDMRIP